MATFNERIQVVIDVVTDKATKGFKDFRTAVGEAEGFTGKLKAGVSSLGGVFGAATSGPVAMGAAVTAAGKFALDAANQFSELGVSIGKFSDAAGLATDDASRWVEVAGDVGVNTDTLTRVFDKLNKSIDPGVFDQLGIAIARTSEGNVNVSETFLNVIDKLNQIQDPAQRAEYAAKLLGKGWTDVAELVGMSANDIRKQLAGVDAQKVFTPAEVKQARDYRAAMDNLNDAVEKIAISIGQKLGPQVAAAANTLADFADVAGRIVDIGDKIHGNSGGFLSGFDKLFNGDGSILERAVSASKDFVSTVPFIGDWLSDQIPNIKIVSQEYSGYTDNLAKLGDAAGGTARYLGLLAEHTRESSDAAADLTDNARLAKAQLKLLQDQIDGRKSFIDLQIQLRDNAEKINTLSEDFKKGKITAEDYYLGVASSALDSKGAVADYVSTVDAIPETQKLELTATLDPASPGAIVNQIQGSLDSHVFQVRAETARENRSPLNGGTGGNGGPGGNGGVTVVVNAPVGANLHEAGKQVHDALQAYYRNGGPQ